MEHQDKINSLIDSEQSENLQLAESLFLGLGYSESESKQKVYGFSLKLFLRLITTVLFSRHTKLDYKNTYFYVPRIICVDGFIVSIQIQNANYCSSENGYGQLGFNWEEVEFGFPTPGEELLENHESFDGQVGSANIELLQQVIDKHGGVNWVETLSINNLKSAGYDR